MGVEVQRALTRAGKTVHSVVIGGDHVHSDEFGLARVLTASPHEPSLFLAVGSGTITDITRYISFRLGQPFISVPTASSVDGFASMGSPLVIEGVKRTHMGHTPQAIFADTRVIATAPKILTAAGFGDLLGKITASVRHSIAQADAVGRRQQDAVELLFRSLIETGLCMIEFGESRPASGAEHHISHFWEMSMLRMGIATELHGIQVGMATVIVAEFCQKLRALSVNDAAQLLKKQLPFREVELTAEIRAAYGTASEAIIKDNTEYLKLTADEQSTIAKRITANWDEVLEIARAVPEPEEVQSLLMKAGAPVDVTLLGLPADQLKAGVRSAHSRRPPLLPLFQFPRWRRSGH